LIKGLIQQAATKGHGFFVFNRAQVVADFRTGTARTNIVQPLSAWAGGGGGNDLHRVTTFKLGAQRSKLAIDLGSNSVIADVSMDAVGKVHWSCTAWQRNNLAFGRMDVNRIGEQVNFDMLQEFCGVTRLA